MFSIKVFTLSIFELKVSKELIIKHSNKIGHTVYVLNCKHFSIQVISSKLQNANISITKTQDLTYLTGCSVDFGVA